MGRFAVRNHIVSFWKKCAFLSFFTSNTKTHVLYILHGLLLFFSWNRILYAWIIYRYYKVLKKTIGWQDLAPHWAYNVNQGWEWYIAWLFCTAVCSLYFSDLSEIILGNRVLQQNIFLYLIRKLLNSQLQLMHVYSFVNRHSLLKVVYNI